MSASFVSRVFLGTLLLGSVFTVTAFKAGQNKQKASPYNVTFINKYWKSMHLQVRVGNQSVPENNQLVFDGPLNNDQRLPVGYDVSCYYRRDADPDHPDNVHFTQWTSTGCFRNQSCVVDNP